MPERAMTEIVRTNLLEHPAVKAWEALRPARVEPAAIETLQGKQDKAQAYRLHGVGPGGTAVVAKRCRRATGMIERTVYEEVLSSLPLPALRYYGFVEEPSGRHCWLFVEDAGGEPFSPWLAEHRALAGRWLGMLHLVARHAGLEGRLPDRGPRHYLEYLRSTRRTILENLDNPALTAERLAVLRAILSQYEVVEAHWDQVEQFCAPLPRTLVHADLIVENVRVRNGGDGEILLVFDWELGGWGLPAVDLIQFTRQALNADLSAYRSVVRPFWPQLSVHDLRRLADYGKIFRSLQAISWHDWSLAYAYHYEHEDVWLADALKAMHFYRARITAMAEELGWEG